VPFFKQAEKTFISQLVMSMKLEHFLKDDDIMIEGSVGEEMYFISTGNVSVYIGGQHKAVLHTGQFFGEISLLMGKMKRTATIRANENCKLYSLSRVDVENVMAGYPITMANIKKIAQERLNAANQARRESKINGL
jgi:hyperpolarization activated cyclic nucleotide-gated potassium channel 2